MNKKTYIKIVEENPKITYKEIIKKFECKNCNKCKNQKLINTCCIALELAVTLWKE